MQRKEKEEESIGIWMKGDKGKERETDEGVISTKISTGNTQTHT